MKKAIAILLVCILSVSICACNNDKKAIDEINKLIETTAQKETLTQAEVDLLLKKYNNLSDSQKELVDKASIDIAIELRPIEKAAVAAVKSVKNVMKSPSTFKLLNNVKVKEMTPPSLDTYIVGIEYSAQNGFGATIDNTSYIGISNKFYSTWLDLSMLTGKVEDVLNDSKMYLSYSKDKSPEYVIDQNRILNNLDKNVKE